VLGCEYVIHTASPFVLDVEDPQRDLVDPAVNGTTSVLESVSKTEGVRRVVLTSSFAAMSGEPKDSPWSEDDWNDVSSLDSGAYAYSKTMAERAAWDFMGDNDRSFDLVVINPTGVIGPSIVPRLNQSHSVFVSATNGEIPGIIDLSFPIVDVRDVAKAHILAMENPGAAGRYLCSAETRSMRQNFELLKEAGFGERYKLASLPLDNALGSVLVRLVSRTQPRGTRDFVRRSLGRNYELDTSKIRTELGLEFRDADQTVIDTMTSLENWGHLGKKTKVGAAPSRR
jgi:dihydroflavonol-4-reductase